MKQGNIRNSRLEPCKTDMFERVTEKNRATLC